MSPDGSPTRVDSVMLAALAQTDYPAYMIEGLIASGGMSEVYRRMAERRTYKPGGLSVKDIAHVVREVLGELSAAGLRTAEQERQDNEQGVGERDRHRHAGLFPVQGVKSDFPPPLVDVAPRPLPGKDFQDVSALDVPSIKRNVTLLRAEMLIQRWRERKATAEETMNALRQTMIAMDTNVIEMPQDAQNRSSPTVQ